MRANDLLNFVALSTFLTGKRNNIRKECVPKKHREKVKELTDFVEYWIQKHDKDEI
jgi:hypothetical protein